MTARICQHGRQFVHCGDCWNNRCDICEAALDQIDDSCLEHGKREHPLKPLAEEE